MRWLTCFVFPVVIMVQEADFPESIPIGYRGKGDTFGVRSPIQVSVQPSKTRQRYDKCICEFES